METNHYWHYDYYEEQKSKCTMYKDGARPDGCGVGPQIRKL